VEVEPVLAEEVAVAPAEEEAVVKDGEDAALPQNNKNPDIKPFVPNEDSYIVSDEIKNNIKEGVIPASMVYSDAESIRTVIDGVRDIASVQLTSKEASDLKSKGIVVESAERLLDKLTPSTNGKRAYIIGRNSQQAKDKIKRLKNILGTQKNEIAQKIEIGELLGYQKQDIIDFIERNYNKKGVIKSSQEIGRIAKWEKDNKISLGKYSRDIVKGNAAPLPQVESAEPVLAEEVSVAPAEEEVDVVAKKIIGESAFEKLKKQGYTIEKGKFDRDAYASFFGVGEGVQADEFKSAGLKLVKPVVKTKFYRGVGRNAGEGANDAITWVAEDKKVAENYSNNGSVEELEIEVPKNPFSNPENNIYVQGSDVGNKLRIIRDRLFKEGKITREQGLGATKAIDDFVLAAGEDPELYSTKTNKKGVSDKYVKALQLLGYDGIVQKESYNSALPGTATKTGNETITYGIFKPTNNSEPNTKSSPFTAFDPPSESMSREQGRKARAALKEAVGPEQFKRMEAIHKNKEKVLEGLQSKGILEIICP